jgi:hypothetical protein
MPERERTFFLGIGHTADEVSVLLKVLLWASYSSEEHELMKIAHTSQATIFAKLLAGKLCEAWKFIDKSFFKSSLSKDWEPRLLDDGRDALHHLKQ